MGVIYLLAVVYLRPFLHQHKPLLSFVSRKPTMHIAILYESRHGQTKKIAQKIQDQMVKQSVTVSLARCRDKNARDLISKADALLFGSSIQMGKVDSHLIKLIRSSTSEINKKPNGLFLVSLANKTQTAESKEHVKTYFSAVTDSTGWKPGATLSCSGALPFTRYNFFIRFMLKQIGKKQGENYDTSKDYEYTDFTEVETFALTFIPKTI